MAVLDHGGEDGHIISLSSTVTLVSAVACPSREKKMRTSGRYGILWQDGKFRCSMLSVLCTGPQERQLEAPCRFLKPHNWHNCWANATVSDSVPFQRGFCYTKLRGLSATTVPQKNSFRGKFGKEGEFEDFTVIGIYTSISDTWWTQS